MKQTTTDLIMLIMAVSICLEMGLVGSSFQSTLANVSVLPRPVYSNPGQQVTVDVNISDVANLFAYDISVWYQNYFVNATAVI